MSTKTTRVIDLDVQDLEHIISKKVNEIIKPFLKQQQALPIEEGYIEFKEACEVLHMAAPTLYSKTHKKEVPFTKKGRLLFKKEELLKWLEAKDKHISDEEAEMNRALLGRTATTNKS